MRIRRLHIKRCQFAIGFKKLSDFAIEFDVDSPMTVLVGRRHRQVRRNRSFQWNARGGE